MNYNLEGISSYRMTSAAIKKALNDRGLRAGYLATTKEEVVGYCGGGNPTVRKVQKLLNALNTCWEGLMNAQVSFCAAAGIDMESDESRTYLQGQQAIYFAGKHAAEEILEAREETEEGPNKEQLGLDMKMELAQLEVKIKEDIKCLTAVLAATTISREGMKEAGDMIKRVDQQLEGEYKGLARRLGDYLSTTEAKSEKENANKFVTENLPLLGDLKTKLMMKTPTKEEKVQPITSSTVRDDRSDKRTIKTAPLPVPKWDGKTRTFPRWKQLWEENIIPYHQDSALHMMLVQALPKEILDDISSLASSYQEIWEHLEEKAGKVDVVARDIMGELFSLSHKKHGSKFVAKFSVVLEDSEALLTTMGQQAWLTSPRSVADLEDLLPTSEKLEWARRVKGAAGVEKYEKFKTFLRERKEELEALDAMGNKGSVRQQDGFPTCTYCHKRGHVEMEGGEIICRAKINDQKMGDRARYKSGESGRGKFVPDYKNGCAICGDREHWKNECPHRGTDRDKFTNSRGRGRGSAGRGGGQGNGRDGAQVDGVVQSNQLRSSDCNRCKYAGKNISTCISCKQTGNVDHCVLHCEQYLCLGVEDRVKLVRTANACAVCLNAGHQAATSATLRITGSVGLRGAGHIIILHCMGARMGSSGSTHWWWRSMVGLKM